MNHGRTPRVTFVLATVNRSDLVLKARENRRRKDRTSMIFVSLNEHEILWRESKDSKDQSRHRSCLNGYVDSREGRKKILSSILSKISKLLSPSGSRSEIFHPVICSYDDGRRTSLYSKT